MKDMQRLQYLRKNNGLTQKGIADILGITEQCYRKYEYGKISIPISTLIKLADFYNTNVDYLLGITDQKVPHPRKKSNL